jgi:chromosome segregation ATPase
MSFDYEKIQKKQQDDNSWWASYSDLYTMMSVLFLMMYVVASLRTGTSKLQSQLEINRIAQRNAELEKQIQVYNTLKEQEVAQASQQEQEVYKQLMEKLSLLKDDAKDEKDRLRKLARENEKKEFALNQYQQIVRNIIDANVLAKAQINRRDTIIEKKDESLTQKQVEISDLSQQIEGQEQIISQNEKKIEKINDNLDRKIKQLRSEQKQAKITKEAMNKSIANLRAKSAQEVAELQSKTREVSAQLEDAKSSLSQVENKLSETEQQVAETQKARDKLKQDLESAKVGYTKEMESLRTQYAEKMRKDREEFQKNLAAQELSAKQRAERLSQFTADVQRKSKELEGKLSTLKGKISETENQLADAQQEKARALASIGDLEKQKGQLEQQNQSLSKDKATLSGDLKKAQEMLEARKNLSREIAENFKKAKIAAKVDEKTGDVTLDFGDDYFDSGSAILSDTMKQKINKLFPEYAKGLFKDPKTAAKISDVEIVGFASSTYKGKYVNPKSLRPEDQEAVNYNLSLSFNRANSIFKHVFNTKNLQFDNQGKLLPKVKVVGRGFLPEGVEDKDIPDGISEKDFCAKYNCKRAQRVIIKFNLKE